MARAYATLDDMTARYGTGEMRRVSVADGEVPETIIPERIERALSAASSVADTFLSVKMPVPIQGTSQALTRAVCQIARYDLWTGGDRTPSDEVTAGRDEALAWLKAIAEGKAVLDEEGASVPVQIGGARVSDRPRDLSYESMKSLG